jgi:hypothetical protein
MQKRNCLFLFLLLFLVACSVEDVSDMQDHSEILIDSEVGELKENTEIVEGKDTLDYDEAPKKIVVKNSPKEIIGPVGCIGDDCNEYFQNNPEESQKWCDENPETCNLLRTDQSFEGPNGCTTNCERFCDVNEEVCKKWCKSNLEKNPELCGFVLMQESGPREGDGVWEKSELTFFIQDQENVLTPKKREIIIKTITSNKESNGGFYGWNKALEKINKDYPNNKVPDKLIETENELEADILIRVHSVKEFCCDLTGDPIIGRERSEIDENNAKLKSNVDAYNIVNIDEGFLEDMMRHELGHTLGIFGHVVNRKNDLMSIVSPASVIKDGNLNDLYIKYRDRIIESMEESIEKDESVADQKVKPPS